jgi:hypothetical protein
MAAVYRTAMANETIRVHECLMPNALEEFLAWFSFSAMN